MLRSSGSARQICPSRPTSAASFQLLAISGSSTCRPTKHPEIEARSEAERQKKPAGGCCVAAVRHGKSAGPDQSPYRQLEESPP
jgi:hypothetical protein